MILIYMTIYFYEIIMLLHMPKVTLLKYICPAVQWDFELILRVDFN